jgi:hypothetical protein
MSECVVVKTDGSCHILPDVTPSLEVGKLVLYGNEQKEVVAAFAKGEWANFYMETNNTRAE